MTSRLAWFTPLPPVRSGIASYSAELLPMLSADIAIDVFVDANVPDTSGQLAWSLAQGWSVPRGSTGARLDIRGRFESEPPVGAPTVLPAWDFLACHDQRPYDLVVYQLGNASCHDYTWPYLVRFPGLVVLHDGRIHHARARALVARHRYDDYRAEFRFNQPDADPTFAEYAINGFAASLYYFWPFRRAVVAAARAVAVHSPDLVADLRAECPEVAVTPLRQGLRGPVARPTPIWQPSKPGIVFGAYGLVTPAKRVPQILRAFASTFRHADGAHLLLAGDQTVYYDARADAAALGIADRVTIAGYVPDEDLDAWIQAADVCLCLRWPTAGETSGPWIRALGAGKPTVITALRQYLHVPTVDARTGTIVGGGPDPTAPVRSWREAVAVSVDLVDEDAALALALRRLFSETALREALGRNARGWWERHHAPALMAADYREAIAHALSRPARPAAPPGLPPHLLEDGGALTRALTAACGVEVDIVENAAK